jgi:transglutaminase-like putative cysteine protease
MRTFFRALRIVAAITLFFFSWTFLPLWQAVAFAAEQPRTRSADPSQSSLAKGGGRGVSETTGDRFEKALEAIRENISKAGEKAAKGEDDTRERETIKAKRVEIESADVEFKKEFAATEKKLKDAKLPKEILDRHYKFVNHYEDNLKELRANLDDIEEAKTTSVRRAKIEKARLHLEKVKTPSRHQKLDPNNLPFKARKASKKVAPRLKKEDFERDFPQQKKGKNIAADKHGWTRIVNSAFRTPHSALSNQPILLAFNEFASHLPLSLSAQSAKPRFAFADSSPFLLAQATGQPSADDLAETPEVQFTDAIRAKAQELGSDPVKIYNWVRNNIDYQCYYGSFKGAQQTLLEGAGNDFDQASLLIALLRASNIAAKYAYGTVEIPAEKVANMVGLSDPKAAASILATQGIPVKTVMSGGTVKAIQMERIWVAAFIDYFPSWGARHKQGGEDTWIPLDPSFKQYTYKQGMDLYALMGFNGEEFLQSYITDTRDITAYQDYSMRMNNYLSANLSNATIVDIFGADDIEQTKTIIKQEFPYLLGTLPYKVIIEAAQLDVVPAAKDYTVVIQIEGNALEGTPGLNYSGSLNFFTDKRVTVSYELATASDEALAAQYGGNMLSVPPYLLNVKPVLKISGATASTGAPIGFGQDQNITINFAGPDGDADRIQNVITAGAYMAIIFQSQNTPVDTSAKNLAKLIQDSKKVDSPYITLDDLLGQILYCTGILYFHHVSFENAIIAKALQLINLRQPSEAMVTHNIRVSRLFDLPCSVAEGGINVDVDRNINSVFSPTQEKQREKTFMVLSGLSSSVWENRVLETFFDVPAVSAVRLLKLASEQGIPVYMITSTNMNEILQQLTVGVDVKADIQNAVNAGKQVITSQTSMTYGHWNGTGYIIMDQNTGAAGYMISGGLAGSGTAKILTQPPTLMDKNSFDYSTLKSLYNALIIGNAKSYIGTGYVWGGKDPDTGFDCSGFTKYILKLAGFDIPDGAAPQFQYFKDSNMIFNIPEPANLFFYHENTGKIGHVGFVEGVVVDAAGTPLVVNLIDAVSTDEHNFITEAVDERSLEVSNKYWNNHIAGFGRIFQ